MFKDKKIVVIMPAYNAAQTLQQTYNEVMNQGVVDEVIIVDDASRDETVDIAKSLPDRQFTSILKIKDMVPTKKPAISSPCNETQISLLWSIPIINTLPS